MWYNIYANEVILWVLKIVEKSHPQYDILEREAKVFTKHKKIIYEQRMKILTANDQELMSIIKKMITSYTNSLFEQNASQEELEAKLGHLISINKCYNENREIYKTNIINNLNKKLNYTSTVMKNNYIETTRKKLLKIVDDYWISHIETLDINWENAKYYAYSNMDPMEIYERQSIIDLQNMTYYIQNEMLNYSWDANLKNGDYDYIKEEIEECETELA